jgi:hypothetical protein
MGVGMIVRVVVGMGMRVVGTRAIVTVIVVVVVLIVVVMGTIVVVVLRMMIRTVVGINTIWRISHHSLWRHVGHVRMLGWHRRSARRIVRVTSIVVLRTWVVSGRSLRRNRRAIWASWHERSMG